MFFESWAKRFLDLWRQDTVNPVKAEFPRFLNKVNMQEFQTVNPVLWITTRMVKEQVRFRFYLDKNGRKKIAIMPYTALDGEQWIPREIGKCIFEARLLMQSPNRVQLSIVNQKITDLH